MSNTNGLIKKKEGRPHRIRGIKISHLKTEAPYSQGPIFSLTYFGRSRGIKQLINSIHIYSPVLQYTQVPRNRKYGSDPTNLPLPVADIAYPLLIPQTTTRPSSTNTSFLYTTQKSIIRASRLCKGKKRR